MTTDPIHVPITKRGTSPQQINRPQKSFKFKWWESLMGYLFIAPQTIGFCLFVLGPIFAIFVFSTENRSLLSPIVTQIGDDNYVRMFQSDPFFPIVMRNSLIFTAGLVPLNMIIALTLAIMLNTQVRGVTLFRTLFFAPVVTSAVAWAIVWRFLLQGDQGLNSFLSMLGIDGPNWLREPGWAMASVIFTRVIKNVGLNIIIIMSALQNIPNDFNEAAKVDGANLWQRIRYITIPLLAPTLIVVLILTVIGSLQVFDHILLMTGGGPGNATNVLVYYIYFQAFRTYQIGYASALAVVLFVIAFTVTIIQWVIRRKYVYNED
jgi:multiple sugar transport system permease protein